MSNRKKPKAPTAEDIDRILAEIQALPESSLDEVAMELSDVTHHLEFLDATELLRTEGAEACRYGLEQLGKAVAELQYTFFDLVDALGPAVTASSTRETS